METIAQIGMELGALHVTDLVTILTLAALEGILSVDNALVLAILVRALPERQQKRALLYGIVGAFLFRLVALVMAGYLIKLAVFKLIGGGYLVYLAMKHMFFFYKEDVHQSSPKVAASFWKTVLVVELTDIAFSIDSITTAVAMSDKLAVVWFGGIMGIIFLRFAAGFFIKLLKKLPKMEDLAYQLIFFIGVKLFLEGFHVDIAHGVFWMMMGIIAVIGTALVYRDYHNSKTRTKFEDRLLREFAEGKTGVREVVSLEYVPKKVLDHLIENGHLAIKEPAPPPGSGDATAGAEK